MLIRPDNIDRLCHDLNQRFGDIRYSIQTNWTLITKDVISIFKRYNFSVGLSLDGGNESQSCQRVFPNNQNSFWECYEKNSLTTRRRRKKKEINEKVDNMICPKCGGNLITRNGKYGEFIGCSNYPKCKYIKK